MYPFALICSFFLKPWLGPLCTSFLTKSKADSPSKAKAFAILKVMRQKAKAPVSALQESGGRFGVQYEDNLVLSADAVR